MKGELVMDFLKVYSTTFGIMTPSTCRCIIHWKYVFIQIVAQPQLSYQGETLANYLLIPFTSPYIIHVNKYMLVYATIRERHYQNKGPTQSRANHNPSFSSTLHQRP
jgi:hypothetical protein